MKGQRVLAAFLLPVLLLLGLSGCGSGQEDGETLTVRFFNTGKSDAILLYTAHCTILNDAADADDFETISKALQELGRTKIDCLILSHYDKDHIGAAPALLKSFEVGQIIGPSYSRASEEYAALVTAAAAANVEFLRIREDLSLRFGGLSLTVFAPKKASYESDNDFSLLTEADFGSRRLLLCGDARKARLAEFCESDHGQFDLVKLPHHGEYNSGLKSLLAMCEPAYCVLCTGNYAMVEEKLLTLLAGGERKTYYTFRGEIDAVFEKDTMQVTQRNTPPEGDG